ncbi:MAG: HAMP domain-containing sensor histidine kinase [Ardenticatenaceae bacterium]|nr:HAMP domain-containing sensor histidine kinase [Ardenticatenaceae bacterium]
MMSLRWRIIAAFGLVILLTILLSAGVAFWSTQTELIELTEEIGEFEAESLADILSREYTLVGSLERVELILAELGYLYDPELFAELSLGDPVFADLNELSQLYPDEFETISDLRVIIADQNDVVIADSFFEFNGEILSEISTGHEAEIIDYGADEDRIVGTVYIEVLEEYLSLEAEAFLQDTLINTIIGGLLTAIIALLLGAWLTGRITAPVTALTDAARSLTRRTDPEPLPVTSNDELGQMTIAFNQMIEALQTQRNLRQRLINDVSHELNTPLSVIQLEAAGLRDGLQEPQEAAVQIIQEINLLRNLVHDLNWLAETDSGEVQLNLASESLVEILTEEIERWQGQARSQSIHLNLEPLPDLPPILVDRLRMSQIFGNLISNALQHSAADGQITAAASLRPIPMEEGEWMVITVADDGEGIDPADLPHIFERFYRADQARSRLSGGRGLGLSLTRQLVRLHGGYIWVESQPGLGSKFFVALKPKQ